MKKNLIIDCDPGMDDSMAIALACKSAELEIKAITTVNGNYPIEVTTENALKVLELLERTDIPVGRGVADPLIRKAPSDPFSHGSDGQAEMNLPQPTTAVSDLHAVDLMIETINNHPNEIYIACLGPLSNLALAMIKEPTIKEKIAGVYAISGAFGLNKYSFLNATGDTPQSEWNVYVDPEAADIVYNSGVPFVALGLDVATHFDVNIEMEDIEKLRASQNPEAAFLLNAIEFVGKNGHQAYTTIIDCMAVGYAIDSTLVKTFKGRVGIETKGELTFGNTVLDRRHHHVWEHLPLIEIGYEADYKRFLRMLLDRILL